MKTLEKIEIDGEVREVEIDWSMYGASNNLKSKGGYINLIAHLKKVNGKLLSKYISAKDEITYKIDDIQFIKTPDTCTNQVKRILKARELCNDNNDILLRIIGVDSKNSIVVEIKTFDGAIINKSANRLTVFYKARNEVYNTLDTIGAKALTPFVSAKDNMKFKLDDVILEMAYDKFKTNTIRSINNFFNLLETVEHHKFIKFSGYSANDNGLVATISSSYGEVPEGIEVSIGSYKSFVKSESDVINMCKKNNFTMKTQYKGNQYKILIDYNCEHEDNWVIPTVIKKGSGCPICSIEKVSGENNWNWQGGITPLHNYLRRKIKQWKIDSFKKYKYKCAITGCERDNVVHHLIGFNTILFETMETLKLPIYQTINEYTPEELKLIEDRCLELHYKYGLGVVLSLEVHDEFHNIYGYGDNTPEQFEEFKNNKLRELKEVV